MQRGSKILVIAVVAGLTGGATYFFRKSGPSSDDVVSPPAQAEAERHGVEKPAPQSHLLGEIQAANQPAGNEDLTPIAPATSAASSTVMPANPFNAQPGSSVGQAAAATAKTTPPRSATDNQFFPPVAGGSQSFGASPFSGAAPAGGSEVLRHKIVDGDTLTALAERYLGSANRYLELYEMNRDTLTSPDLLPIGAELKVPARGLVAPPSTTEAAQPMVPLAPAG